MKIYINNVEIQSEILPLDTPTLDETLETFSFALISNTIASAFAPMQTVKFELENDDNEILNFVLTSDNVDIFSFEPLRYKHSITCVQNTRILSKHIVRDSVFTQPSYKYKEAFNAECAEYDASNKQWLLYNSPTLNQASEKLELDTNEKISKAYIEIDFQYSYGPASSTPQSFNWSANNIDDISAIATSMVGLSLPSYLILQYKDANNVTQTENITPSDLGLSQWTLNSKIEYSRIVTLQQEGCYDFKILFNSLYFITNSDSLDPQYYSDGFMTFYMVQIKIIAETYYWTAYDILDLLNTRYKQINSANERASLFALPTNTIGDSDLYNLLINTVAPNFTFTQLTMYECIADVFRLFDAIFTMDDDGVLGIEYFNDANKTTISNPKFTGRNIAIGEDKYTNGLISYYQDGRTEETFPSNNSYAHLRSAEYGVPEADDHIFITPHPIHNIVKVELVLTTFQIANSLVIQNTSFPLDITRYVIEESIWTLLSSEEMSSNVRYNHDIIQANSICYSKGDNKIKCAYTSKSSWGVTYYSINNLMICALSRMAGVKYNGIAGSIPVPTAPDWRLFKMRLTYETMVDGKSKIESITDKYNGETIIDQYNGAVDLNKMGLNMLGLSLKLGEPTLNCSYKISKWDNRIKVGDIYNYNDELWIANVCSYTILNDDYIQGKISFVKNYNALALRTQLLREKRISNIASELVNKSEEIFNDFIYFASRSSHLTGHSTLNGRLRTGIYLSFKDDESKTDYYGNFISIFRNPTTNKYFYIPMIRYGFGNSICFEMSFDSPINAGNKTYYIDSGTPTWFGDDKYYTEATNYTDDKVGFIDNCYLYINDVPNNYTWTDDFPEIALADYPTGSTIFSVEQYEIKKQPNEIFAFNYQLSFIPYSPHEDFVGGAFINDNFFTSGRKNRKLYLYYSTDENFKYSILDTKGKGDKIEISDVSYSSGQVFTTIIFVHEDIESDIYSWAICDINGNILFASNNGNNGSSSQKRLYFAARHTRLNTKNYTDDGIEIV